MRECDASASFDSQSEHALEISRLETRVAVDRTIAGDGQDDLGYHRARSFSAGARMPQREGQVLLAVRTEQVSSGTGVRLIEEDSAPAHRAANRPRMKAMYARAVRPDEGQFGNGRLQYWKSVPKSDL